MIGRPNHLGMNWRQEIWPFQWRIALSWISGYLAFQLFSPLLFVTYGPVAAGQMGMSLQIIGAMNGAAMAWITTKAPTYGNLIAQKRFIELNALFNRGLIQSFSFLLIGVFLALTILSFIEINFPNYAHRILSFPLMTILCVTALVNHVVGAQGAYLRAYKRDPFMVLSVISGVAIALFSIILIPIYGVSGAVGGYFSVAVSGLIVGTKIFHIKRAEYINA
jgi:hypothetical protein